MALAAASLDSQLGFIWDSPIPAQVAAFSDCFIAQAGWLWAKHRWGVTMACTTQETPGPAHLVNIYRPCGRTYHHPAPAHLILHRGQRLVVSCHSQSLQLTGLGKSLPLTYQQQPRLHYKRSVCSAHVGGTPRAPSLGDRGGSTSGPCKPSTTLGHTTKTQSHSSST